MEYMVDRLLHAGLVRKGGIGMLICDAELLYEVARGIMELF